MSAFTCLFSFVQGEPTRQAWEIYRNLKLMSTKKRDFFDVPEIELVGLASIEQIGPATWTRIYSNFKSLSAFLGTNRQRLAGIMSDEQLGALDDRVMRAKRAVNTSLVTLDDPHYPKLLKEIADPPLWLFYEGNLEVLNAESISIVGSRKHTAYAKEALNNLISKQLAKNVTIVSGLAYGIDKMAHQISLESSGKTVAVLAGGLDKIYPSAHHGLAKEIVRKGGILISEYPPGSPALPYRFPIRNRIIAGLSRATLVVEAAIKSGTISTARSAVDYNRELFVVPGDITRSTSEGCNFLISQGAVPAISHITLDEYYNLDSEDQLFDQETTTLVNLHSHATVSARVLQLLSDGKVWTINQLVNQIGESIDKLLRELTLLELSDKIYQERPGYYKTKNV